MRPRSHRPRRHRSRRPTHRRCSTTDILYSLDATGFFAGVDTVGNLFSEERKSTLRNYFQSLSDEQIVATFAEEVSIYHTFDGLRLEPGLSLQVADDLTNELGIEPYPATATFSVDDAGFATMRLGVVPDDEALDTGASIEAIIDPATGTVIKITGTQRVLTINGTGERTTTITVASFPR